MGKYGVDVADHSQTFLWAKCWLIYDSMNTLLEYMMKRAVRLASVELEVMK